MTLPLPHLVQRSRLIKLAIGASDFSPKRLSVAASIVLQWRQCMQRMEMAPVARDGTGMVNRPCGAGNSSGRLVWQRGDRFAPLYAGLCRAQR